MKFIYLVIIAFTFGLLSCKQDSSIKTDTFEVWGNCEKCKKTIENSVNINGVSAKNWNTESKLMTISFDTTIVKLDQLKQLISKAGYDNDTYYGDDYAYGKLEACCQYERRPFEMK